jgi:hypothetical protein
VNTASVERAVRVWLQRVVIDLNLCPFARRELALGRIRFCVSAARTRRDLLADLLEELLRLDASPDIETTLLIHPGVLREFAAFNQFLSAAEDALDEAGLTGQMQIASFHPDYRFVATGPDDAGNYTNRSPYPILHLLRESSVTRAVAQHPDTGQIPLRNVALLEDLGSERMRALWQSCFSDRSDPA